MFAFLNSEGDMPKTLRKDLLNDDAELKPQSKAIASKLLPISLQE